MEIKYFFKRKRNYFSLNHNLGKFFFDHIKNHQNQLITPQDIKQFLHVIRLIFNTIYSSYLLLHTKQKVSILYDMVIVELSVAASNNKIIIKISNKLMVTMHVILNRK